VVELGPAVIGFRALPRGPAGWLARATEPRLRHAPTSKGGLGAAWVAGCERLHAIVDGLALHAVLDPEVTTPARQVELLALEFDALAR
jgi:hypothetical protein